MNVGVIGCGYVGLVTASCFAELGHTVAATDSNNAKLALLRQGLSPIHEEHLPQLLQRHTGKQLQFCDSIEDVIRHAQAAFICVGTPSAQNGEVDLSEVDAAVDQISRSTRCHLLIVEKSTVPVRTCETIRSAMLARGIQPDSFAVASNPEFLREGSAVHDFLYPDRIVVGCDDERSRRLLEQVYLPLTSGNYYRKLGQIPGTSDHRPRLVETTAKSAELIKHASNAFLAMKISFINAVATVAEAVDADISDWSDFAALDLNRVRRLLRSPLVFDGRNLYSPSEMKTAGLSYVSAGRAVFADSNTARAVVLTTPAQEEIENNPGNVSLNAAS